MNSAVVILSLLLGAASNAESEHIREVICTEMRDEPGTPAYTFELRRRGQSYTARYMNVSSDRLAQPDVVAEINRLDCRFRVGSALQFHCSKPGAEIEGVEVIERKLSLVLDDTIQTRFREFRATGIEVPGAAAMFRFGPAATCRVSR